MKLLETWWQTCLEPPPSSWAAPQEPVTSWKQERVKQYQPQNNSIIHINVFFTDRGFTIINWKYLLWSSELVQLFTMKIMVCNFFHSNIGSKMGKKQTSRKKQVIYHYRKNFWEKNMLAKRNLGTVFPIQLCTPPTQKITYLVTCKISPVTGRRVCPSGRGAFGSGLVAAEQ